MHAIYWQPLNVEHFDSIRKMASEIHAYASDARVLTTYYCGEDKLLYDHISSSIFSIVFSLLNFLIFLDITCDCMEKLFCFLAYREKVN